MAKNLSIVAQGISGDEGHLLGYNVSDNGIYTPAIGDVVRGTSGTRINQSGNIEVVPPNVARVDYTNGVAELLLEPTSTNLIQYSEGFSNSYWGKSNTIVTDNSAVSPSGLNNASLISASGSNPRLTRSDNFGGGDWSLSWFAKKNTSSYLKIRVYNGSINNDAEFDLENGVLENGNGSIKYYGNGWYRCTLNYTTTNTHAMQAYISDGNVGDLYLFGAQLEQLSSPTSYTPTNGAIATRGADSLTNFGSEQIIDSGSGILFFEGSANGRFQGNKSVSLISTSSGGNRMWFQFDGNEKATFLWQGGGGQIGLEIIEARNKTTENHKYIARYSKNRLEVFFDGVSVYDEAVSGATSQGDFDVISFAVIGGANNFYGRARQVKHLPYNTDISTL